MLPTRRLFILLLSVVAAAGIAEPSGGQTPNVREVLAPSGKLRVGVYPGSPTSLVQTGGERHGISYDLGQELARRIDAPFELVTYSRVAEVIDAMKTGAVDFTVTNATSARAQIVDFSPTLLSLELGYLVPANSPIRAAADVDKPGHRIGVTLGSTSERTLPTVLANAKVVPAPNVKEASQMLASGQLEAFATNKAILFEMSDGTPGTRVLEGRWGTEHMAIAVPKGRAAAHAYLRQFTEDMQKNGMLARAIEQSGLRGTLKLD